VRRRDVDIVHTPLHTGSGDPRVVPVHAHEHGVGTVQCAFEVGVIAQIDPQRGGPGDRPGLRGVATGDDDRAGPPLGQSGGRLAADGAVPAEHDDPIHQPTPGRSAVTSQALPRIRTPSGVSNGRSAGTSASRALAAASGPACSM
jgi:hypothetical protein